jgi:translation initiation factor 2 subunit 1
VVTKEINNLEAYVELLEYDNIKGFITFSQFTKNHLKSVGKFLKIGKQEMVKVFRVDLEKMCINLKITNIQPEL